MKFLIISHVEHTKSNSKIYGYGPYIKEMNLWLKYVDQVRIVAPIKVGNPDNIDLEYKHDNIIFDAIPSFNLIGIINKLKTLFLLPYIFFKIVVAMKKSDHIHLRCPGNVGLLGTIAQIFFPNKIKTAKYAGNWDPQSDQPKSYTLQKKILSSAFLSKNMKVLVYGKWKNQSKNIISFFTATYLESEKKNICNKNLDTTIRLLFVGSLSIGKRPMIALESLRTLRDLKVDAYLDILGEGNERTKLEDYILKNNLSDFVKLHGNQNSEYVKKYYTESHFLILMSKSEGWPKVVAEAMFWGCVPISSKVSCVEYMLDYGNRGKVVDADPKKIVKEIIFFRKNNNLYTQHSELAYRWSRIFTLDKFDNEIGKLLNEK